jgi:hypothetical protein
VLLPDRGVDRALMSIGAPSKVVKMPEQWRSPAFGPACSVQAIPPAPPSVVAEPPTPSRAERMPKLTTMAAIVRRRTR